MLPVLLLLKIDFPFGFQKEIKTQTYSTAKTTSTTKSIHFKHFHLNLKVFSLMPSLVKVKFNAMKAGNENKLFAF